MGKKWDDGILSARDWYVSWMGITPTHLGAEGLSCIQLDGFLVP